MSCSSAEFSKTAQECLTKADHCSFPKTLCWGLFSAMDQTILRIKTPLNALTEVEIY